MNSFKSMKKLKQSGHFKRCLKKDVDAIIGLTMLASQSNVPVAEIPSVSFENQSVEIGQVDNGICVLSNEIDVISDVIEENNDVSTWDVELSDNDNVNADDDHYNEHGKPEFSTDLPEMTDDFRYKIKEWAINFQPTQTQLRGLLAACNSVLPFKLPSDPRTIMETPTTVNIISLGLNEQYWHHGLRVALTSCFQEMDAEKLPSHIALNINMDGLSISKSSHAEFWPILFNIDKFKDISPKVIGIYYGKCMKHFIFCELFNTLKSN